MEYRQLQVRPMAMCCVVPCLSVLVFVYPGRSNAWGGGRGGDRPGARIACSGETGRERHVQNAHQTDRIDGRMGTLDAQSEMGGWVCM